MNYFFIIVLGLVILGILFYLFKKNQSPKRIDRAEVSRIIERFLNGTGSNYEWDDFISLSISDSELERIRTRCANLPEEFPPTKKGEYCSEEGIKVLQGYITELQK